jgi:inner membrane protein
MKFTRELAHLVLKPWETQLVTTYTHGFVGLGLGAIFNGRRASWLFWMLAVLLPICPDFDVFSTAQYGSPWGHRGFTHSLAFALVLALICAAATRRWLHSSFWALTGFFFILTASHGVLDAFTNGGEGIPFFWPFSDRRFGPWGPIQVQDIGFELPDPRQSRSIRTELLWVWLPTTVLVGTIWLVRSVRRSRHRRIDHD